MTNRIAIALLPLSFSLSGCAQDYSLDPPADSEQMTITVKVPKELKAETLEVMYRSAVCKRITSGASGQRIELEGYHGKDVQLQRRGQTDLYEAKLPMDGGGDCQWHLSNVMFGVAYGDTARFGEHVTYGAGGGVVVIFDHNNSPRGGADIKVDGDLTIKKDYYPWVDEEFLGPYKKTVSLAGQGDIYLMYQALQARQVYFEPVLHSDLVVYSAGPKVKQKGNHTAFKYPDGSVVADGKSKPDFLKLQSLRTGRSTYCFSGPYYYARCPDRRPQLLPDPVAVPDMPGYSRYVVADEWGNLLPSYFYRLLGKSGQIYQGMSDDKARTQPLATTEHPLRKAEFPERVR